MLDLDKITDAMVAHTMKAVAAATAPLLARIETLEGQVKAAADRPVGVAEEKFAADLAAIESRMIKAADAAMQKAVEAQIAAVPEYPQPEPLPDIAGMVAEAVAAIPVPRDGEDGKSVSVDDVAPIIRDEIAKAMESVKAPELPDIAGMVSDAVGTIPAPQDGKSVTLADVSPLIEDAVTKAVSALPVAKDGTGLAGALIDREGNLVITLSNGEVQKLGVVVGKDADPAEPGRDGLGFEDLDFETDEHGRVTAKFHRGDLVKSVRLPSIVDRGPYKAGDGYDKGDAVSYGGSLWIAQEPTGDKPDGSKAWRLAVKKGRDAKGA